MRWLLFLSRLSFICGIFFLLSLSMLVEDWVKDDSLISTIITIGFFMGMIIVPITLFCYLALWLFGKKIRTFIPRWLIIANILVLFILLGYIVYNNNLHSQFFK